MSEKNEIIKALIPLEEKHKTNLTVDCVIFGYDQGDLKVLTIECDMDPFLGMYSLIGDFVKETETTNQAAKRILKFCTGNDDIFLEEVQSFSEINRHPYGRVITIAYYSLVQIGKTKMTDNAGKHLQWTSVNNIKEMAFDHKQILDLCLFSLRRSLRDSPIGFELLPKKFSLKQLQTLYEVVLDIELDKRNFRRKLRTMDILIDVDELQQEVSHRPAKLYKFNVKYYESKKYNGFKFDL